MQITKSIPVKTDVTNVVTLHKWRDLDVQPVDINARPATSLVILVACATIIKSLITREIQENLEHISWWLVELLYKVHYVINQMQV